MPPTRPIRLRLAGRLADWAARLAGQDGPVGSGSGLAAGNGSTAVRGSGGPAAAGRPDPSARRRRRIVAAVAGVLALLLAVMFIGGLVDDSDGGSYDSGAAEPAVAPEYPGADASGADIAGDSSSSFPGSDGEAGAGPSGGSGLSEATSALAPDAGRATVIVPPDPGPSPGSAPARPEGAEARIVRTGKMIVEVPAGGVEQAVQDISAAASALDGYTESSEIRGTASTSDDTGQYAAVTLRVPAESFERLRTDVAAVGTVTSSTMTSRDVTGEYVDLEARKQALEASRNAYLTLLAEAATVGEMLSVQQAIDGVQIQIEQIQGRQTVLADASDLATLTVEVSEEGAPDEPSKEPSGLSEALERSWDRFMGGIEEIVALLGPLALAALLAGAAYGVVRLARRLRRARRGGGASRPDAAGAETGQPAGNAGQQSGTVGVAAGTSGASGTGGAGGSGDTGGSSGSGGS